MWNTEYTAQFYDKLKESIKMNKIIKFPCYASVCGLFR